MKREKSVKVIDFQQQRRSRSRSSSFRAEMGNKSSYVFWSLVGVFSVILWVGLYFGFVVPMENSFNFKETQCTIVQSVLLPNKHICLCTSTPCPDPPKTYPCILVYVNYTRKERSDSGKQAKSLSTKLHFSESIVRHNCSYVPNCDLSQPYITSEAYGYFRRHQTSSSPFKCFYNRDDECQVIEFNYSSKRLAVLLPFAVVLFALLGIVSFRLYRRGCGCNAKRRPSRLSFMSSGVDEA